MPDKIQGRPRLPRYDPTGTPPSSDLAGWRRIVAAGGTGLYAGETLLKAFDEAGLAGDVQLARSLANAAVAAGRRRFRHLSIQYGLDPAFGEEVEARAALLLHRAVHEKTHEDGRPRPDHGNIRGGYFRFLRNRWIDAFRAEKRIEGQACRDADRAALRSGKAAARIQEAINGRALEGAAAGETLKTQAVVSGLLQTGASWKQIADDAGLQSADAARKRFSRLVARLGRKRREGFE